MISTRFLIWLAAAFLFFIGLGYFFYGLQPVNVSGTDAVRLTIDPGDSFRDIGASLSQNSLIRSVTVFKLYSVFMGRAHTFKPGSYALTQAMSVPEIVYLLTAGGAGDIAVTIPEGVTLKDVDALLTRAGVAEQGEISALRPLDFADDYDFVDTLSSLEGFMFPDTYRFEAGMSGDSAARVMLDNFEKKVWPLLKDDPDWYEKLIIASFVEREVPAFEDRRKVAGILIKRLEARMPLQVDATLSFAKCGGYLLMCDNVAVSRNDTELSSPFNTYKIRGVTPTPIANPGVEAVKAVINPIETPYWYYLSARETGETIFSRTLDEHNSNRAKYLSTSSE